uniref:Uncharacterized protein n=1 Tax=virus sp. ctrcb4 TaxID=2825824 RepID=A0A8S5RPM7_9VIRU|nr:MAG TPA: hypothetical protein [virus sp. ctrcb4]DAR12587.1 MAG TPA: hypothetical protein [Crassvirales sp.]
MKNKISLIAGNLLNGNQQLSVRICKRNYEALTKVQRLVWKT